MFNCSFFWMFFFVSLLKVLTVLHGYCCYHPYFTYPFIDFFVPKSSQLFIVLVEKAYRFHTASS